MRLDETIFPGIMQVGIGPEIDPETFEKANLTLKSDWLEQGVRPRAVVLLPNNLKAFSTGVDRARAVREGPIAFLQRLSKAVEEFYGLAAANSIPVLGVLSGMVIGGGAEIILRHQCIRFALPGTSLQLPEFAKLGLTPGLGGAYLALRLVRGSTEGTAAVLDWIIRGTSMNELAAKRFGLVDFIISVEKVDSTTDKMADQAERTRRAESAVSHYLAAWLGVLPSRMGLRLAPAYAQEGLEPSIGLSLEHVSALIPEDKQNIARPLWSACFDCRPQAWEGSFAVCLSILEEQGQVQAKVNHRYGQPSAQPESLTT